MLKLNKILWRSEVMESESLKKWVPNISISTLFPRNSLKYAIGKLLFVKASVKDFQYKKNLDEKQICIFSVCKRKKLVENIHCSKSNRDFIYRNSQSGSCINSLWHTGRSRFFPNKIMLPPSSNCKNPSMKKVDLCSSKHCITMI